MTDLTIVNTMKLAAFSQKHSVLIANDIEKIGLEGEELSSGLTVVAMLISACFISHHCKRFESDPDRLIREFTETLIDQVKEELTHNDD